MKLPVALALLTFALPLAAATKTASLAAAPAPISVMVLGAYHFGNPGQDVNNMKVDSVLTPQRQAELAAVAKAIAAFKPTRVMVEMQSKAADLSLTSYAKFTPADLATDANEITQIGFRIARLTGASVHGIDEQPGEGEPDYFPYDKLQDAAAKFHQQAQFDSANADIGPWLKNFEAAQKTHSVAQMLTMINTPGNAVVNMDFYYAMLAIGDNDAQPGADLNAMWYLRNAKIFGKLMHASQPGDRVLVVYGSGHSFWLRHFAQLTPGYRLVEVLPYLKQAKVGSGAQSR